MAIRDIEMGIVIILLVLIMGTIKESSPILSGGTHLLRMLHIAALVYSATSPCNFTNVHNYYCRVEYDAYQLPYLCRVEYDAYRLDVEALQQMAPRDASQAQKLADAQQRFEVHREKFERLRGDVTIKMKFLDDNRVSVMFMHSLYCTDLIPVTSIAPLS